MSLIHCSVCFKALQYNKKWLRPILDSKNPKALWKDKVYWVWMCSVCCSVLVCFCSAIAKGELCRPACENGGRCVANEKGDWRCYCWPNFSGERCEINHCTDYCLNGGTCTGSPLGKKNLYLYVSSFCQLKIFLWLISWKNFLLWPASFETQLNAASQVCLW